MTRHGQRNLKKNLHRAREHMQGGRAQQAELIYREILQQQPRQPDALLGLGRIAYRNGHNEMAVELFKRAIAVVPNSPLYYVSLGLVYKSLNQPRAAIEAYESALKFDPDYVGAHYSLADIFMCNGQFESALLCYKKVSLLIPEDAGIHFNLGKVLFELGRDAAALDCYRQALKLNPSFFEAHSNLAIIFLKLGQPASALVYAQEALSLKPDDARIHYHLGDIMLGLGRDDSAVDHFRQALKLKPVFFEPHTRLAAIFMRLGQPTFALSHIQEVLRLKPDNGLVHCNLADILYAMGEMGPALEHCRRALALLPDDARVHHGLCLVLAEMGGVDEALEHCRQALVLDPGYLVAHSTLLFLLSYNVLCSPEELLAAHESWGEFYSSGVSMRSFEHGRPVAKDRQRLRIGYVSPNLNGHAVSYFVEPLLDHHDRQQVEVFCYAEVNYPDEVTERLQGKADCWRLTKGLSDEAVAQLIYDDGIDILVDLAGHTTSGYRLKVFVYKPAPVQVSYLGYCATTGLASMDYWITDTVLHPEDTVELASEHIYRLSRCWLCYRPKDTDMPLVQSSLIDGRPLTFGSLNQLSKLTADVIKLWSEILLAVPGSCLLIKARSVDDLLVRDNLLRKFSDSGISADRLLLLNSSEDYLDTYNDIDIALDPFPRTGGATTADALWMGVPVITLSGDRMISRQGTSMLRAVGLDDLIAETQADYVALAVSLAGDDGRRQALHEGLRQQMLDSPLCDGRGLAQALEEAYRTMWKNRVRSEEGKVPLS